MNEPIVPQSRPNRRDLYSALAVTHLPLPVNVEIYERDYSDWAGFRLDDNAPEQVEVWATFLGDTVPHYAGTVTGSGSKPFRSYQVDVTFAGWRVEVCSYVDLDVVPVDQPIGGQS